MTMEEPDKLQQLKQLQEKCRAQDDQKQDLITGLFSYVDDLLDQLEETKRSLVDQKELNDGRLVKIRKADEKIHALIEEKERHVFAVVLIDGDCMPFKDELVKEGLQGGRQAACNLMQAAKELLKGVSAGARLSNSKVVVRVYANLKGLAKTYKDLEVLADPMVLYEFVRGFNMVDGVCDFTDAGNGKECSDEKVKDMFRLNVHDVHCQQILFGGSADNGYARLLTTHIEDKAVCDRVTLLEGPPFAAELAEIKNRFRVASFNDVFRRDKLQTIKRRVSFHLTPPATPSLGYARIAAKPASAAASGSLAESSSAAVQRPPAAAAPAPASIPPMRTGAGLPQAAVVKRNRLGQRVDPPLEYSQMDFLSLKHLYLCNHFHILGECPFQGKPRGCQHEHGERISESKRQALRAVARMSPCTWGLGCPDPKCLFGHRCTRPDCGSGGTCRFSREMHNVDTVIVS